MNIEESVRYEWTTKHLGLLSAGTPLAEACPSETGAGCGPLLREIKTKSFSSFQRGEPLFCETFVRLLACQPSHAAVESSISAVHAVDGFQRFSSPCGNAVAHRSVQNGVQVLLEKQLSVELPPAKAGTASCTAAETSSYFGEIVGSMTTRIMLLNAFSVFRGSGRSQTN